MNNDNEIGSRLRHYRKMIGKTQEQVAKETGYEQSTISLIEGGQHLPSVTALVELCICLHTTPDAILLGSAISGKVPERIFDKLQLLSDTELQYVELFIDSLIMKKAT